MSGGEGWGRYLAVLSFVGCGAAVVAWIYGLPVGLLVLAYYYIGLHLSDLQEKTHKRGPPVSGD